ncbi:hypothetical protein KAH94_01625 [bacterium]|nr:hypothetical protein [bacterium]
MKRIKNTIFAILVGSMAFSAFGNEFHVHVDGANLGRRTTKMINNTNKTAKELNKTILATLPMINKVCGTANIWAEIINKPAGENSFMLNMNCEKLLNEANEILNKIDSGMFTAERITEKFEKIIKSPAMKKMVENLQKIFEGVKFNGNVNIDLTKKELDEFKTKYDNGINESKEWRLFLDKIYYPIKVTCYSTAVLLWAVTVYVGTKIYKETQI